MENRDWMIFICEVGICLMTAILLIIAIDHVLQ